MKILAATAHHPRRDIDHKVTRLHRAWRARDWRTRAAHLGPYPRTKFGRTEWLGDIVVGTCIEQGDLFRFSVTRRQHEDRDRRPFTQLSANRDARPVRQSQIQD